MAREPFGWCNALVRRRLALSIGSKFYPENDARPIRVVDWEGQAPLGAVAELQEVTWHILVVGVARRRSEQLEDGLVLAPDEIMISKKVGDHGAP